MGRPVTQWQVITPDPAAHASFYAKLFGWTIDDDNPMAYRQATTGGAGGIDGGFWPAPEGTRPFVQLYIDVENVNETFEQAVELGCQAIAPPQALPDGGSIAILHDPSGMPFAVVQKAE